MTELRRELEASSFHYMVVKNTLARLALEKAGYGALAKLVTGGTGIALGEGDAAAAAKILSKFSKTHEPLKVLGGYLDGSMIDGAGVAMLATLPGRNELLARVLATMNAPASSFARVLSNTIKSFLYAVQAIKEKQEEKNV
jgi:large subunit ribosomal protein L10